MERKVKPLPEHVKGMLAEDTGALVIEVADEKQRERLLRRAALANAEADETGYYPADMLGVIWSIAFRVLAPYGLKPGSDTARQICECLEGCSMV